MIFDERPPLTRTDKLCALSLAGLMVLTAAVYELTDGAALRAAAQETDKPAVSQTAAARILPGEDVRMLATAISEAVEDRRSELYWQTVPLDRDLQKVLWDACEESGVPLCLALGLIDTESGFDPEADNGLCFGLCQLNKRYYPADLTPAENIRAGVAHLGALLEEYSGDTAAALTAYNAGRDTGSRTYANAVLSASEKWGVG